jgi:BASS family bile acid:Na+ symporter
MKSFFERFNNLYPLWLLALACVAYLRPSTMLWFDSRLTLWALGLSMLGMGLTLSAEDFQAVVKMRRAVALGFGAQYSIMPLSGWLVSRLLHLPNEVTVGLILVASCPGGMASNMISYLAGAHVALSVVLTLCSTLLSFAMTPLWCQWLVGERVPVDAWGLSLSALQMVVGPVLLGGLIRWRLPALANRLAACGPSIAVVAFILVSGGIVARSAASLPGQLWILGISTTLLHLMGFGLGYGICRLSGQSEVVARTVSIEVGMQNAGMAAGLAGKHFPALPLAAATAVFSAVLQNLLGGLLAAFWQRRKLP